jgi:hypothetical protein
VPEVGEFVRGEVPPREDAAAVDRLFDPRRDPEAVVAEDEWYPHFMSDDELDIFVRVGEPTEGRRAGALGRYRGPDTIRSRRLLYANLNPSAAHRLP